MNYPKYDAYKDSGVEWLGEVPVEWTLCHLKRYLTVQSGDMLPAKDILDDGIPVIGGNGYRGFTSRANTLENTIVIGRVGAKCGCIHIIKEKFWASEHAFRVVRRKNYNLNFIAYFLENINLNKYAITTAQPLLNTEIVTSQLLVLPSQQEQIAIAAFLDQKTTQINQAIAIKQQQIALLNERRQILIQQAVTKGLDSNAAMKDSGVEWIGEIPEHWEICANRVIFKERVEAGREGLPLLSVSIHTGVSSDEISDEENVRGRVKIQDKSKYILVKKGDIAFNMMRAWQGGIGAVSVDGMVSPAYIVAAPTSRINANFFEYQYRCADFIQQMDRYSKGITDFRKRLYWESFKQLSTIVPPMREQLDIINFINDLKEKIDYVISIKKEQIQKLKEYKTTLINDAVTGKIKVA